jgi:uncharacterized membrane protein YdjX (TVP38/TMEM64 family)
MNALPAFAPPTWMALVFFLINYDANPVALVIIGVISATTGRAILAWYFRKFAHVIPTKFSRNMEYAGHYFTEHSTKRYALLGIFLISPISSAQLFEAAGLMKSVALRPLLIAFAAGRTISYSTYVTGAAAIATTNFGDLLIHQLKSPWAIATQILLIAGLAALGSIDWKSRLHRRHEKRQS